MMMMSPLAIINSQMEDTNISFPISDKMWLPRKRIKTPQTTLAKCFQSLLGEGVCANAEVLQALWVLTVLK